MILHLLRTSIRTCLTPEKCKRDSGRQKRSTAPYLAAARGGGGRRCRGSGRVDVVPPPAPGGAGPRAPAGRPGTTGAPPTTRAATHTHGR